jgi:hypothetical protein
MMYFVLRSSMESLESLKRKVLKLLLSKYYTRCQSDTIYLSDVGSTLRHLNLGRALYVYILHSGS